MVNRTTGSQRYNNRMDKIFEEAKNELPSSLNNFYWRKGKVVKRLVARNKVNKHLRHAINYGTKDLK